LREDLEQLTALHESEGGGDSGAAVEKSKLIISALKKGVQMADDVIYNLFEIDLWISVSNLNTR
jgi:hypothetical protein